MKSVRAWPLVELAILFFAAGLSRDLVNAWRHSPPDRLGWLALLVWLAPLALRLKSGRAAWSANFYLLGVAIGCGLLGELTEVHFLNHVALALALGAWLNCSLRSFLWLLAAVAWMPVFGWWLAGFPPAVVLIFRLALALAGVSSFLWIKKSDSL